MCFLMFSFFFVLGTSLVGAGCIVLCQCVFLCFLCSLFWEPPWLGQVALFFVNVFSYVVFVLCSGSLHGWGRLHCSLPMCFLIFSLFFVLGISMAGAGCIVLCQCVFLIFLCSLLGQVALFFVNVFSYVVFVLCSGSVH